MTRRIENLEEEGNTGVISDLPHSKAPIDAWSDAKNVRFRDGQVSKIGGYMPVMKTTLGTETIRRIHAYDKLWYYATDDNLFRTDGATHTSVHSFTTTLANTTDWSSVEVEGAVYFNNPTIKPLGKTPDAASFSELSGWKDDWRCNVIYGFRNFILALGMEEGGKSYSQRVRWSKRAEPNALPSGWDDASYVDLPSAVGSIVAVKALGATLLIYTTDEIYRLSYTGGDTVFRIEKAYAAAGALTPDAVAEFENKHFVVSKADIFVTTGTSRTSVASGRVSRKVSSELLQSNPAVISVVANYFQNEIWMFYNNNVDSDLAENVAIWNWKNGSWTFADVPPLTTAVISKVPSQSVRNWDYFDDNSLPPHWEDQLESWRGTGQDYAQQSIIAGGAHGTFYALDQEGYSVDKDGKKLPLNVYLLKENVDIHKMEQFPSNHIRVTAMYPYMSGTGSVLFRIGSSDLPQGSTVWGDSYTLDVANDYKLDTRLHGRFLTFRIEDISEHKWQYFGTKMDVKTGGRR